MPIPRSLGGTKMPLAESNTVVSPITMRPESGRSRPARQRSVVVLPQPEGPSSVNSRPRSTLKLTLSTARTSVLPEAWKTLLRFSMESIFDPVSGANGEWRIANSER